MSIRERYQDAINHVKSAEKMKQIHVYIVALFSMTDGVYEERGK